MNIKVNGIYTTNQMTRINTTSIAIIKKIIFLFFIWEKVFFRNDDEPHFRQTILPPKDLSETKSELPQLRQNLFEFIIKYKNHFTPYKLYSFILNVKKNLKSNMIMRIACNKRFNSA